MFIKNIYKSNFFDHIKLDLKLVFILVCKISMSTRVYVGRLSYDCRERDLEKFFKGYGKIRDILLKNGFGFVVSTIS